MPLNQDPITITETINRARVYKSRNKRPCDFCRYKKAACHLKVAPPCELCVRYGKECTFVESPAKRRRPNELLRQPSAGREVKPDVSSSVLGYRSRDATLETAVLEQYSRHVRMDSMDLCPQLLPSPPARVDFLSWEPELPSFEPALGGDDFAHDFHLDPQFFAEPMPVNDDLGLVSTSATSAMTFEGQEFAVHSLRDSTTRTTFPACRPAELGPALHFENILELTHEQPWKKALEDLIPPSEGARLVRVYYDHIHSSFPILPLPSSCSSLEASLPTHLLAAIYAHALGFTTWETGLTSALPATSSVPRSHLLDALFALSHVALQAAITQSPDISTIQTILLHIHRWKSGTSTATEDQSQSATDANASGAMWAMMCQAVGLVQALGLDRENTSGEKRPTVEQGLGKRVAWGVWVTEKWLAAGMERRSLIGNVGAEWEVERLTADDFMNQEVVKSGNEEKDIHEASLLETPTSDSPETKVTQRKRKFEDFEDDGDDEAHTESLIHLCGLTEIVDDILTQLYSNKALRELGGILERTLEVAKPLRLRLREWLRSLPEGFLVIDASHSSGNMSSGVTSSPTTTSNSPESDSSSPEESSSSTDTKTVDDSSPSSTSTSPQATSPTATKSEDLDSHASEPQLSLFNPSPPDYIPKPQPDHQPRPAQTSTAPLHLSYITAKILLFRALLRASASASNTVDTSTPTSPALLALRIGALCTAHEVIAFISNLQDEDVEAWWPGYAALQVSVASRFMLEVGKSEAMVLDGDFVEEREVLLEWRNVLRERMGGNLRGVVEGGLRVVEESLERLL